MGRITIAKMSSRPNGATTSSRSLICAALVSPARWVASDPTGAGDAFAVAYLASRADGHAPAASARRATALVATLLSGRAR